MPKFFKLEVPPGFRSRCTPKIIRVRNMRDFYGLFGKSVNIERVDFGYVISASCGTVISYAKFLRKKYLQTTADNSDRYVAFRAADDVYEVRWRNGRRGLLHAPDLTCESALDNFVHGARLATKNGEVLVVGGVYTVLDGNGRKVAEFRKTQGAFWTPEDGRLTWAYPDSW